MVSGHLPSECFVDAFDLCTIFSNILLNALEASEKCEEEFRRVKLAVSFDITQTGTKTDQVSWFVNGKQTKSILPFSMALGRGRRYKLSYQLNGAKVKGKLPKSYRYGDIVEFPRKVTKKGYIFSG